LAGQADALVGFQAPARTHTAGHRETFTDRRFPLRSGRPDVVSFIEIAAAQQSYLVLLPEASLFGAPP
jgi:hypothetical protein